MNSDIYSGRYFHRCRTLPIVAVIIPTLLFAFALKSARAGVYKLQPILCDGVDDATDAPILCALPKETTKELSETKPGPYPLVATEIVCILRYKFHAVCATGIARRPIHLVP